MPRTPKTAPASKPSLTFRRETDKLKNRQNLTDKRFTILGREYFLEVRENLIKLCEKINDGHYKITPDCAEYRMFEKWIDRPQGQNVRQAHERGAARDHGHRPRRAGRRAQGRTGDLSPAALHARHLRISAHQREILHRAPRDRLRLPPARHHQPDRARAEHPDGRGHHARHPGRERYPRRNGADRQRARQQVPRGQRRSYQHHALPVPPRAPHDGRGLRRS